MRHSLNYGLLNHVELSDEKIKATLPKDAVAELEKANKRTSHPAAFLVKQVLEKLPAGDEFTVTDIYVLLHQGQDGILVKMSTLRSTLSTLHRKEGAIFEPVNRDLKHRIYKKL